MSKFQPNREISQHSPSILRSFKIQIPNPTSPPLHPRNLFLQRETRRRADKAVQGFPAEFITLELNSNMEYLVDYALFIQSCCILALSPHHPNVSIYSGTVVHPRNPTTRSHSQPLPQTTQAMI